MSDEPGLRQLPSERFRDVIGHFASGVTVITAVADGRPYGTTASAVASLSLDPPMVLICMNRTSETGRVIADVGRFAINILSEDQPDAAVRFAGKGDDKFAGIATTPGAWGEPLIDDALATLECRVVEDTTGGTHWVFLAEVDHASARPGAPLTYFRGEFHALATLSGDEARDEARATLAAVDLGVAAQLVGTLSDDELANCRRLADEQPDQLRAHLVQLTGGAALLPAYRRLRMAAGTPGDGARELVEAYAAGDLAAVAAVIAAGSMVH